MATRVLLVGLGPIGVEVGKAVMADPRLRLVGAVDVSPTLAGCSLAQIIPGAPKAARVKDKLARSLAGVDVIALCTSSRLSAIADDLRTAASAGVHVVSTCEELSAPLVAPALWKKIDAAARKGDITVWGTGVNPGFVLDRLVLTLAQACVRVDRVIAERVVDSAKRRGPLRAKVGEGLTEVQFRAGVEAGKLGHVGLVESAWLIAQRLGWAGIQLEESIEPVLDANGQCRGIDQVVRGESGGKEKLRLQLAMFKDAPDPHDWIVIHGDPPLSVNIDGGTQGDRGTIGTMVNALARVSDLPRGLITVEDLV